MFPWYSPAARCYVYLSDVLDPEDPTSTVESAFEGDEIRRKFALGYSFQSDPIQLPSGVPKSAK